MLGAGFVTRPTLDILSDAGIPVTVGMVVSLFSLPVLLYYHQPCGRAPTDQK